MKKKESAFCKFKPRSGLDDVSQGQLEAAAKLDKLMSATDSRDRGQMKANERIEDHIQVRKYTLALGGSLVLQLKLFLFILNLNKQLNFIGYS